MNTLLIVTALNIQIMYPSPQLCDLAAIEFRQHYKEAICIPAGIEEEDQMVKMFNMMKELIENVESKARQKNPSDG